jgi:hypothetical protein
MADEVAWRIIEHGWSVVASDGDEVGTVDEVLGDSTADIFNGVSVSPGLLRHARYVPAERVARIVEGRVELDLPANAFERLPQTGDVPHSAEIRADTTDLT